MAGIEALLINLGNLAGATALATQTNHGELGLWHPRLDLPAGPAFTRSVQRQAEIFGVEQVTIAPPLYQPESALSLEPQGMAASVLLMAAAQYALEQGCRRLIWPVQIGPDYEAVSAALERAQLVTHLIELDLEGEPLLIELPFVELTDTQIGEIALHADAPVQAAWWCEYDRDKPCGGCDACLRWRPVADAATPPGRVPAGR